jgi:GDPmannose 4,6-dehydratase
MSAQKLGVKLEFSGEGLDEVATIKSISGDNVPALSVGDVLVLIDPADFRPAQEETLLGDPTKAKEVLG